MNKRPFFVEDYKKLLRRLLDASDAHDGQELQRLEDEIIDTYKETLMKDYEYRSLIGTCDTLLEDWRRNYK